MTTALKTQAEAIVDVRNALIEFELNGDITTSLKDSVAHSLSDIQVRDFTMGITYENNSPELVVNFLECVLPATKNNESVAINSVLSAYYYRLGNTAKAYECLSKVDEISPTYSLATLLKRVYGAGWPAGAFESMTIELHPKVVEGIEMGQKPLFSN